MEKAPTEATSVFVVKGTIDAETQHVILGSLYQQGASDGREARGRRSRSGTASST